MREPVCTVRDCFQLGPLPRKIPATQCQRIRVRSLFPLWMIAVPVILVHRGKE